MGFRASKMKENPEINTSTHKDSDLFFYLECKCKSSVCHTSLSRTYSASLPLRLWLISFVQVMALAPGWKDKHTFIPPSWIVTMFTFVTTFSSKHEHALLMGLNKSGCSFRRWETGVYRFGIRVLCFLRCHLWHVKSWYGFNRHSQVLLVLEEKTAPELF